MASGTIVRPDPSVSQASLAISLRCSSSFRVRRAAWLVHVPKAYSGMWALRSHTSPSSTVANASASERGLAQGLDLGAGQHEAGLEAVTDVIVVTRLAILGDHDAPLWSRHASLLSSRVRRTLPRYVVAPTSRNQR